MSAAAKRWYAVTVAVTLVYLAAAAWAPRGYGLTVFGDLTQQAVLAAALIAITRRISTSQGLARKFWIFMTFGAALWFVSQLEWLWYEVWLRLEVPDPSAGDVLLFLHTVPIMAALALRPHYARREGENEVYSLDLLMLLLWWVFLYGFVVMSWQFNGYETPTPGDYYSILYFAENIVMMLAAAALWWRARGEWRAVYGVLALSGLFYALCSVLVNRQIFLANYYTGSYYDVPLVASILLFGSLGVLPPPPAPESAVKQGSATLPRVWSAALAAFAVLSLPLIGLWALYFSRAPRPVNTFRLGVTLAAAIFLTLLAFTRRFFVNRELRRLLDEAHQSYLDLQRVQGQLISTEKLAALGQLVAGAAHEINNPLTAILGYSELLASDHGLAEQPRSLAEKIGAQARRTKRLVANMLSFAQQQPASRAAVQANALLNNALQLREPDLAGKKIHLITHLAPDLPDVWGDGNHLLQVFFHILNNAVDALEEVGGGALTVSTRLQGGRVQIDFSDTGPGIKDPGRIFDPFYTTKPVGKGTGLGLSVCYGVIQDHGGEITCYTNSAGGASFLIKLPPHVTPAEEPKALAGEVKV